MPICSASTIKSDWLNIAGADTTHDALLGRLIAYVSVEIRGICSQPIEIESIARRFTGNGTKTHDTYYTSPVTLTSITSLATPDATPVAVTGCTAYVRNGIYSIYNPAVFTSPEYIATLGVGFGTMPADIELCAIEMVVELYNNTSFTTPNRFGVSAVSESVNGLAVSKAIASMRDSAAKRLRPYTRFTI